MRCFLTLLLLTLCAAAQPTRIKKNEDKEPASQTLPPLKEPPNAVTADASRLSFSVSTLSNKGLLTPQMRDALKQVMQSSHGGTLIKLRAFVAGTGDLRRVQTIVSEAYADKKEPLPAVTVVQVGALPLEGAQVVLESISEEKKTVNPGGVEFSSGTPEQIEAASGEALRVTCLLSSLDQEREIRAAMERKFPHAALNLVQALRDAGEAPPVCEAVSRRASGGAGGKLIFSGLQMAFGEQEADLKLAFDRLGKTLDTQGASFNDVVYSTVYALSRGTAERAAAMERPLLKPLGAPLMVENLPSIDASLGIEVVASVRK